MSILRSIYHIMRADFLERVRRFSFLIVVMLTLILGYLFVPPIDANYQTKKRVEKLWKKLERLELDKNRLQLAWISAAEGEKFASKIREMQKIVDGVTKEEIEKTVNKLTPKKKVLAKGAET